MKNFIKFKIPGFGESYEVYIVENSYQNLWINDNNKKSNLYFCLCEIRLNDNHILSIVSPESTCFRKLYSSDVVVEKIDDKFVVHKNRYGYNSTDDLKIFAEPVYENN